MSDVTLTLTLEEAVAITNLVGSTPVSQGGAPLFEKLRAQVEPLLPPPAESEPSPSELAE
jgi:hypothetical protein